MSENPLNITVTDDGIMTISIGVDQLAYAFEECDDNNVYDETLGEFVRQYFVVNPQTFARDVRVALLRQKEDGSTPLTVLLDKACWDAVEDGSQGVEVNEECS